MYSVSGNKNLFLKLSSCNDAENMFSGTWMATHVMLLK